MIQVDFVENFTTKINCLGESGPPVSGSCHSYFQMVLQVNLNWAYCCLALHSLEEMVCMTSLPPAIAKVLWMVLDYWRNNEKACVP